MAKQPHILLTGGGTGGHVMPIVAVCEALAGQARISVIAERGDAQSRDMLRSLPVEVFEISAGKLRRYHGSKRWYFFHPDNIWKNVRDSGRLVRGWASSLKLLKKLKPDVVFVKGGYVGLPVGLAAAQLGIPLVTHDSDVLPGMTNRILGRFAQKIAVGFPRDHYPGYPGSKLVHVGIPVRRAFSAKGSPAKHRRILVVGGSLGARAINHAVLSVGKHLMELGELVHISGEKEYDAVRAATFQWRSDPYKLYPFVGEDYPKLVNSVHLVICRAGATTLAECAVAGIPVMAIPNPSLTGGHQLRNAEVLEDASAAVVIGEPVLAREPMRLVAAAKELLGDKARQAWLVKNAHSLFPADGAKRLADLLIKVARAQ